VDLESASSWWHLPRYIWWKLDLSKVDERRGLSRVFRTVLYLMKSLDLLSELVAFLLKLPTQEMDQSGVIRLDLCIRTKMTRLLLKMDTVNDGNARRQRR
jgi:hypothetical protein